MLPKCSNCGKITLTKKVKPRVGFLNRSTRIYESERLCRTCKQKFEAFLKIEYHKAVKSSDDEVLVFEDVPSCL